MAAGVKTTYPVAVPALQLLQEDEPSAVYFIASSFLVLFLDIH